jgi:hypothetical protein
MPPVHFHIGCISEKLPYLFENAKHWLVTAAILDAREKSVLLGISIFHDILQREFVSTG